MTTPNTTKICAHCGQVCGDYEGGYWNVTDETGAIRAACSPMIPSRPDCHRRVTEFGEPLGALRDINPKPAGIEDIRRVVTSPPPPVPGPVEESV